MRVCRTGCRCSATEIGGLFACHPTVPTPGLHNASDDRALPPATCVGSCNRGELSLAGQWLAAICSPRVPAAAGALAGPCLLLPQALPPLRLLRLGCLWCACTGRSMQRPCWPPERLSCWPRSPPCPPHAMHSSCADLWVCACSRGVHRKAAWRRSTSSERASSCTTTAPTIGASPAFSRAFTAFTSRSSHRARICRRVSESLYRRLRLRPHTWWRARRPTQRLARSHRKWHRNWHAWYCEMRRGQNQREVSPGCHTMFSCADVHGLTRLGCPNRDRRGVRSGRRSVSSS